MAKRASPLLCALALLAVVWRAYGQDFDLEDALGEPEDAKPSVKPPKPPKNPSSHGTGDFDLADFFDTTQPPKIVPKPPPKKPDVFVPTKKPRIPTIKPHIKPGPKDPKDLDLTDALDPKNDLPAGGRGGGGGGRDISDSDLEDIVNGGYNPDKGKGGRGGGGSGGRGSEGYAGGSDNTGGPTQETVTIAGIASALAMALVSAVSGYISYQQKKFCFSIQQGLNAEYVKGENMEAVMSEEPQVKCHSVPHQSAAPPAEDPSIV